jgi:hypothetical protein
MQETFYFNGDLCQYTGKSLMIHGGLFYEFIYLEGIKANKIGHTQQKRKGD